MKNTSALAAVAILFAGCNAWAVPTDATAAAAEKFDPAVTWQQKTVLLGDFTCKGKKEAAILGTSPNEIVVAVFLNGVAKTPAFLRYSTSVRSADSAILTTEDLNFKVKDFEREVGRLPNGLRPSKTCLGLNMSDQMIDSAHIYWNCKAKRFEDWVR